MADFSRKKAAKIFAFAMATVILSLAFVFAPSILAGDAEKPLEAEVAKTPAFSVKVADAERRTLRSWLEVNGDIISNRQVTVFPEASGRLARVLVALGSVVRQGELIAEVNPSRPGVQYSISPVYAPISGTVSATPLAVGSTVTQNDSIAVISVIENLQIEALIPEREISHLKAGLKAEVTLQAYPGEIFTATIARVSPVLDPASRAKKIVLTFDKNDSRVNAGMFARVALNTGIYENIITVPVEAVIDHFGTRAVYVLHDERAELREVTNGVTIDRLIEIKTGIEPGEKVIVQGQQLVADGDAVRVMSGGTPL
jgi:multidrug efflux pump subunit AcrA (membrane-fusion protein)